MDYADGGDVNQVIKERYKKDANGNRNHMAEDELLNYFTQMCLAIKHVHDRKILHRDIKSHNFFLTKKGIVKLGDFGIARVLSNTRSKAKTVVGSPSYLSPEIINNEAYSFKSDIWSLGIVLHEMAALEAPFQGSSFNKLLSRIVKSKPRPIGGHYSPAVTSLLKLMLSKDPNLRPTIHQILKTPVIEKRIQRFL